MLRLNRDKTELLVIGPKHKVNPPVKGIHVAGEYIEVSNNARNIGVTFDAHVNLEKHVIKTCKTAFYHLRNIAKIRNCLFQGTKICSTDLFQPYTPTRQLRSSSKSLLVTPKSNLKFYGDRSFQVAAPRLWNSLTDDIRSIQNLDVFKNKIKTLLFREAFIS